MQGRVVVQCPLCYYLRVIGIERIGQSILCSRCSYEFTAKIHPEQDEDLLEEYDKKHRVKCPFCQSPNEFADGDESYDCRECGRNVATSFHSEKTFPKLEKKKNTPAPIRFISSLKDLLLKKTK